MGMYADLTVARVAGLLATGIMLGTVMLYIHRTNRDRAIRSRLLRQLDEAQRDLAARAREAGMQHERQRLARDIHDTLAQGFTSVIKHLEAIELSFDARTSDDAQDMIRGAAPHLAHAQDVSRASLAEIRRLVWALRPTPLDETTLAAAIERIVAHVGPSERNRDGLLHRRAPASESRRRRDLPARGPGVASNVARHARATRVTVAMHCAVDLVLLTVEDDGQGFVESDAGGGDGDKLGIAAHAGARPSLRRARHDRERRRRRNERHRRDAAAGDRRRFGCRRVDMNTSIRILVADDHPIVRSGITSVLATQPDFDVVGTAGDGDEAVVAAARLAPDLVLMDLRMPVRNGVDASAAILAARPSTRIVVLTTFASDGEVLRAIEAGAVGYLLKDVPHEELFRALRAVARGERYLAPVVTERLLARWQQPARMTLTDRELDVLRCVARGDGNKQIAAALGIAEPTVKAHLVHIFEKLGVENRTAASRVARELGLISSDCPPPRHPSKGVDQPSLRTIPGRRRQP